MIHEPDEEFVSNWRKRLASNPRFGVTLPATRSRQEPFDLVEVAAMFLLHRHRLALGDHSADLDAVSDDLDAVSDDELADRLIARRPDLFDGTERKALIDAFAKLRIGDGAAEVRESR